MSGRHLHIQERTERSADAPAAVEAVLGLGVSDDSGVWKRGGRMRSGYRPRVASEWHAVTSGCSTGAGRSEI